MHPRKAAAIKAEVEKLLKAGFIYSIPLTKWVSNIIPIDKKQGTIRVCVDYVISIELVLRIIIPLPSLIKSLTTVSGARFFPLWKIFQVII